MSSAKMKRTAESGSPVKKHDDTGCGSQSAEPTEHVSPSSSTITINHLPQSVLLQIISHCSVSEILCSVRLVSTSWYQLCRDRDIWKHKKVTFDFDVKPGNELMPVLQYATGLCHLSLMDRYDDTPEIIDESDLIDLENGLLCNHFSMDNLNELLFYAPSMKHLSISGDECLNLKNLNDGSLFRALSSHCKQLCNLEFRHIDFRFVQCHDFAFELENLQVLILSSVYGITDSKMKVLFAHLKKLTRLELRSLGSLTGKVFEYLADSGLPITWLSMDVTEGEIVTEEHLLHVARLPRLREFVLDVVTYMDGQPGDIIRVKSTFLHQLAKNCRDIERLQILGNTQEFGEGFKLLAKNLGSKLTELSFSGGSRVSIQDLKPLAEHCRVLKRLQLVNICNVGNFEGAGLPGDNFSIITLVDSLQKTLKELMVCEAGISIFSEEILPILQSKYPQINFLFDILF